MRRTRRTAPARASSRWPTWSARSAATSRQDVQRWPQAAQPPRVGPIVNLPVQFYIPDWSFNGGQQALRRWALVLVGPPDEHGRSRVFTYLVTAGLVGIDWDFGD